MSSQVYLNLDGSGRGGPHVWSLRFRRRLEERGFQVTHDLQAGWDAALFVAQTQGLEEALRRDAMVAFRVANGYIPEWFAKMGRTMGPQHHAANASISRGLESAGMVIYQSRWAKTELDQNLHNRFDHFAIILNGVDLDRFSPASKTPSSIPVIGTAGVLRYRYRLQTFLEMSRRLSIPHSLLIVGSLDDECAQALREYQDDPEIGPRIHYQPHVPADQLPQLYQQMDLLVHPVSGDVCPNVVIEALACGVPVVAPRHGGTVEVVGPGGVIFDAPPWQYDEAFIEAMAAAANQALAQSEDLRALARRQAEDELDVQTMVDRYLQALGLPERATAPEFETQRASRSVSLRQKGARWIARPRFYTAIAMRKASQVYRRIFPPPPNRKPRIAFTLFDFHVGGIENWLYRLACTLREDFDFYFLATRVPDFLPKFNQIGTCAFLPSPAQMIRYLQKENVDIVQVHNERWPVDAALAAAVRHVIERTDGTRSCTRVPKHGLSLVIASSKGTIPLIAKYISQEKIRLVYNGIDLREVDAAPVERPWPADAFIVGRTSRFGRGKNLGLLIQAMHDLNKDFPAIKLVLIGGDSLMPGAEPIAAELKKQAEPLGEAVEFLGIKEYTLPWVKGFDIATCVSNPTNEGIPNSLIEAMACRKAVISTDVDQVGELVQHGYNGLLIPPGDAQALRDCILRVYQDPELRVQLGEAGRRTIEERFSLEHAASQYAAIYRQLLAG